MKRVPALDGVRGIAILLVMLAHLGVPGFRSGGVTGVTLFFVLSGFLITSLLVGELGSSGRIDVKQFYVRRVRRLLPALLALVAVALLYESIAGKGPAQVGFSIGALSYMGNWLAVKGIWLGPWLGHTWSLAIEEQFYLLWPAVIILFRRRLGLLLCLALIGAAASASERVLLWHGAVSENRVYNGTDTRADAILLGSALALWVARDGRLPRGWVAALGAVMLLSATALGGAADVYLVAPTLAALGAVLLLARPANLFAWTPLGFTGRISYSLYLWHVPMIYVIVHRMNNDPLIVRVAALFGVSYALAILSYRFIEQPFRHKRQRYSATTIGEVVVGGDDGPLPATGRITSVAVAPFVDVDAALFGNVISPVFPLAPANASAAVISTFPAVPPRAESSLEL